MDLTTYLVGDGSPIGMSHRYADGTAWEVDNIHQMVRGPLPDQWQLVKGFNEAPCRSEELRIVTFNGVKFFARGWDTSDRPSVYRLTEGALPVSLWCPLDFDPDGWYRRAATVERFNYATGARVAGPEPHITWLHFEKLLDTWTSPAGLTFKNVVVLAAHDGDDGKSKPAFERWWLAPKYGMVQWRDEATGKISYVNNVAWPNGTPQLRAEPLPPGHTYQPLPDVVTTPVTPPPENGWYWHRPVRIPYVVQSSFGERVMPEDWNKPPEQQRKEKHKGTDYTAADWTAYASREGTVILAGWDSTGFGYLVKLDHGGGRTSLYGHLESASVTVGQSVSAGQKIGVIGSTGRSTARHLHYEVRKDNIAYAPTTDVFKPHPADIVTPPPVTEPPVTPPTPAVPRVEIHFADADEKARYVRLHRAIADAIEAAPGMDITLDVVTA